MQCVLVLADTVGGQRSRNTRLTMETHVFADALSKIQVIHQIANAAFLKASGGIGCTLQQAQVLEAVGANGSCTQSALAVRMGCEPAQAAELIMRLTSAGLLCRTRKANDHCDYEVSLTSKGWLTLGPARQAMAEAERAVRARVPSIDKLVVFPARLTAEERVGSPPRAGGSGGPVSGDRTAGPSPWPPYP